MMRKITTIALLTALTANAWAGDSATATATATASAPASDRASASAPAPAPATASAPGPASAPAPAPASTPDPKALHHELVKYLAMQGQLCLGKFDWPIDVSQQDFQENARDALQMPVLEKLGLVTSTVTETQRLGVDDNAVHTVAVKRYELTKAGLKSYVEKDITRGQVRHHKDLCVAKLTLDKIVRWEAADVGQGTVFYTYHVAAVPWALTPDALKVFPMIDKIVKGEGTLQLSQRMQLGKEGWTAVPGV
jgi:hypothetical protein